MTVDKPERDAGAFLQTCPAGALMGIDPGSRTFGIAACDRLRVVSTPLCTIHRQNWRADSALIARIVDERDICGFILGLPLNMDGTEGPRAESAVQIGHNLVDRFTLPVLLWDERLTTFAARQSLQDKSKARKKRRDALDATAACIILQDALDAMGRKHGNTR